MSTTPIVTGNGQKSCTQRGRPRDEAKHRAILDTALEILKSEGYGALSLAKVATLSGIARPTVKLRWKDKEHLAVAVIKRLFDERPITASSVAKIEGSARDKIRLVVEDLVAMLSEPGTARIVSSTVAAAHFSSPMSELRQYILGRRGTVLRGLLQEGVSNGEFASDLDVERTLDALNGPVLYRILITGLPMQKADIDFVLKTALGPDTSGRKNSPAGRE